MNNIRCLLLLTLLSTGITFAEDRQIVSVIADPWCPFNCGASSPNNGIMIDLAREALAYSNIDLDYQNINWARASIMVQAGEVDSIVGMGKSANTEKLFYFPQIPLAFTHVCFYRKQGSSWAFENVNSLKGKTFGLINYYKFGNKAVDDWVQKGLKNGSVLTVSGDAELVFSLIRMLNSGRIDVFGEVSANVDYANKTLVTEADVEEAGCLDAIDDVYIAFSYKVKHSEYFAEKLDEGMRQLLNDREKLQAIFDQYGMSLASYLEKLRQLNIID